MKRDLDLIRRILLMVESSNVGQKVTLEDFRGDFSERLSEVSAHVELLERAGYLDTLEVQPEMSVVGPQEFFITKLEWAGHDYLDAIRDEGIWKKTQHKLKSVGGSASLEIVKAVAIKLVADSLGV